MRIRRKLLAEAVQSSKTYIKMPYLRLAQRAQMTSEVQIIGGVFTGGGGSVLAGVKADLIVIGKMAHHEVLYFVAGGVTVILADHSNTERGYLAEVKQRLATMQKWVEILVPSVPWRLIFVSD